LTIVNALESAWTHDRVGQNQMVQTEKSTKSLPNRYRQHNCSIPADRKTHVPKTTRGTVVSSTKSRLYASLDHWITPIGLQTIRRHAVSQLASSCIACI